MRKLKGKGIYQLFILMMLVLLILTITSITIIYKIVYREKKDYLHELSDNQKEIIQSIYKETNDEKTVLNILYKEREITDGLGETGEYAIGYSKNDSIFFLLRMRQGSHIKDTPIPLNSDKAIPLQYALAKNTGFIQGLDYRGNMVLAYCTYIPEFKWGLVTKMDVSEVRSPFYRAGLYAIISAIILVLFATILFRRFSRPITKKIAESEENYRRLFEYSAIPIWKEDYSDIKEYFDHLKDSGITDFRTYFETHKDKINHLASLIKVVEINQKSVELFNADSKDDVIRNMLFYFNEASLEVFREEMILLAEGGKRFECEIPIRTLTGEIKTLYMHLSVVTGFEDTLSNVMVSFIDITERKINEEKLVRSRQEWIETFDLIPDMVTILDKRHRILRANKAATEKLGVSQKDINGMFCYQCTHGTQESPKFCPHAMMLKDGKEHIADFYEEKLGMDLLVSVTPIYDNNGNITGSVHISRDVTEHKKKEKELNKLNKTLSALGKSSQEMTRASDELFYMEAVCSIIVNDCGHAMVWIGFAEDDEEKTVRPVAYSGFEEGYLDKLNISWDDSERGKGPTGTAIRTGKPTICKNILNDPCFEPWRDEAIKRGYASSIVLPLKTDNKTFGAISIYSKEADPFSADEIELLSELANDLSYGIISIRSRVAQKEADKVLKEKNAELVEINATKDKFFKIIAHDMKNPFISLLGASELLYENAHKYNSEKIARLTKVLNDSAKSGYDMLLNMLEWSRSQAGSMIFQPEKINLKEQINKNHASLLEFACGKKVNLNFDIASDTQVYADKNMLDTVLRNLINNALKFTPEGGKVTVSTKRDNGSVIISVKDTGVGIKKSDFDKLFRTDIKFSQPGTNHEGGTGLGLLLCKEFVEKHGGTLWVESEEDKGSTFYFSLKNIENS
jgi:PAS domain S-box-containing protein